MSSPEFKFRLDQNLLELSIHTSSDMFHIDRNTINLFFRPSQNFEATQNSGQRQGFKSMPILHWCLFILQLSLCLMSGVWVFFRVFVLSFDKSVFYSHYPLPIVKWIYFLFTCNYILLLKTTRFNHLNVCLFQSSFCL